ncbi:hypothetical protein [Belnapia moabensis]|uniref:hypothetical protein n=1 Tax=Belnapia moabensis TaxID=365533 RepID=UPI0005BC93F1|nr:hypothetical protein [Belnapia moabensis]
MSHVVYKPLSITTDQVPPAGVSERIVQVNGGTLTVIRVLDARRATFGTDLAYVFGCNVMRAREENEKVTGSPDGIVVRR